MTVAVSASPYRVLWRESKISVAISDNSYDGEDVQELFTHHCKEQIAETTQDDFDCGRWPN